MLPETNQTIAPDVRINLQEARDSQGNEERTGFHEPDPRRSASWHIPRPSLLGPKQQPESLSRGSTSSQSSSGSTRSASSGTLLLTAANLANLAAMYPPRLTAAEQIKSADSVSVESSTHFTVVNGLGRPPRSDSQKSWCARNQLTVLVCSMSLLFMLGLLAGVLYMEFRARSRYD